MSDETYYQQILASYPEYISKDQMYRICHISKRTCQYLLESGIVPNIDSGKKTRRFKIKTADVVEYLRRRQVSPSLYHAPTGYYSKKTLYFDEVFTEEDLQNMRGFYEALLFNHPDVLTTMQVAAFTGYNKNSVSSWCSKGVLKAFFLKQSYHIPKEYLIDFLASKSFICIAVQSNRHKWFNEQIRRMRMVANRTHPPANR